MAFRLSKASDDKKRTFLDLVVHTMSSIFVPALPVITAAGITKALLLLLAALGVLSETGDTYYCLSFISNAGFMFLPLILAHSTAKHFGGTPYLGMFLASVLFHSAFTSLVAAGEPLTFLTLSVAMKDYGSAIIPGILIGAMEAYSERFFKKLVPDMVSFIFVPLLTTLVTAPLGLLVLGPFGMYLGELLSRFMEFLHLNIGWASVAVLAALAPVMVSAGVSLCLIPLSLAAITNLGFDAFTRPAYLAANVAIAGATFAVFFRSKLAHSKRLSLQTTIIALMGITEPTLYGVLIPLKKPFIGAIAGAFLGGAFAGITDVKGVAYASPSLLTLPIFLGDTFIFAILTCVVSFAAGFFITLVLGFLDEPLPAVQEQAAAKEENAEA